MGITWTVKLRSRGGITVGDLVRFAEQVKDLPADTPVRAEWSEVDEYYSLAVDGIERD